MKTKSATNSTKNNSKWVWDIQWIIGFQRFCNFDYRHVMHHLTPIHWQPSQMPRPGFKQGSEIHLAVSYYQLEHIAIREGEGGDSPS